MVRTQWIGIDFDHTLWDNDKDAPMEGVRDAIDEFRSRGYKVLVHSCNRPEFIKGRLLDAGIVVDGVWGEAPFDHGVKPVCAVYIDDRGVGFRGDWAETTRQALELVGERPIKR